MMKIEDHLTKHNIKDIYLTEFNSLCGLTS